MKVNSDGIEIIKKWEGCADGDPSTPLLDPYICPAGVATIGYGSTWTSEGNRVSMSDEAITHEMASELLAEEVERVEQQLTRLISVSVTENQFSALGSFVYNVGSGNFQSSTLRSRLNRGDYVGASEEFWKWRRGGGVILPGLVARRAEEKELFLR